MVREHNATGAHSDVRSSAGDMTDDDGRRRACDPGDVMVLREPVAMISPPLGVLREVQRVAEGQRGIAALANRRKIENGIENFLHWGELTTFSTGNAACLRGCVAFHFTATRKPQPAATATCAVFLQNQTMIAPTSRLKPTARKASLKDMILAWRWTIACSAP